MEYLTLYNGMLMPKLGFGCAAIGSFGESNDSVTQTIAEAINAGYRHIDTAAVYNTEYNVGQAIKQSGIARREFFIVTKLHTADMEYDKALKAAEQSLKELDTDYIDLYLVHWPLRTKYIEAWRALEDLYEQGVAKAIGGSNFGMKHFIAIEHVCNVKPMSNQVELNPYFQQREVYNFCKRENIALTAWSPLGTGNWSSAKPEDKPISSPVIQKLAHKHNKSPAQIILRWIMQKDVAAIPKSEKPHRIRENMAIFDFTLDDDDMAAIVKEDRKKSISTKFSPGNKELYASI